MKILVLFLFLFRSAMGHVLIGNPLTWDDGILNPEFSPGKFVLYLDGYEDLRFDLDLDGQIDFWRLRKDGLLIEIRFIDRQPSELFIRKVEGKKDLVTEIRYKGRSGILTRELAHQRSVVSMGFSGAECPTSADVLKQKLSAYKDFEELVKGSLAGELVHPLCKEKLGSGYGSLRNSLMSYLSGRDPLSECFKRPEFKASLKDSNISYEVLETSYILERAKLTKDTDKFKPLVSCTNVNERRQSGTGISTDERGKISITIPGSIKNVPLNKNELQHELLHRIGYYSEETVDQIMSACTGNRTMAKRKDDSNVVTTPTGVVGSNADTGNKASEIAGKDSVAKVPVPESKPGTSNGGKAAPTTSEMRSPATAEVAKVNQKTVTIEKYQGSVNAAASSTANIPKNLTASQANIPSSETLSEPIYSNPQKTPKGIEIAYKTSTSQSKGILSTANNLLGAVNTPALAKPSLAANSQLKEIASASGPSGVKGASSTATVSGITSRNNIKSDETVVESITLNDQKPIVVRADLSSSSTQGTRSPPSETRTPSNENNPGGSVAKVADTKSSGSESAQVDPYSSMPRVSLGSGTQNSKQRQPASVQRGRATAVGPNSVSKEEVITYISQGDFNRTKQRLRDPNFTRQLEMQSITILDLYGKSVGAKSGDVIFLEKEDRFVRQK